MEGVVSVTLMFCSSSSLQEQPTQANFSNICTGLEILSFLLTVLQSPAILAHFKPLQRGIAACMTCGNTKVLRAVHTLLSRLMSIFPTEPSEWPSGPASGPPPRVPPPGCLPGIHVSIFSVCCRYPGTANGADSLAQSVIHYLPP